MTEDLHARLLAAVRQRMETAQAVNGTEWPRWWSNDGGVVGLRAETNAFIAANDPATILRHCERDLKVLERHVDDHGGCAGCGANRYDEYDPWPCDEIKDLCTAYGVDHE